MYVFPYVFSYADRYATQGGGWGNSTHGTNIWVRWPKCTARMALILGFASAQNKSTYKGNPM